MRLEWTRSALRSLDKAQEYIAKDNPPAAKAAAKRVKRAAKRLLDHPRLGRKGHVPSTRECPVNRTPYLIVYRIEDETIEILRIWDGRTDWQNRALD